MWVPTSALARGAGRSARPLGLSASAPQSMCDSWAITRRRVPEAGTHGDRYCNALWQAGESITQAI